MEAQGTRRRKGSVRIFGFNGRHVKSAARAASVLEPATLLKPFPTALYAAAGARAAMAWPLRSKKREPSLRNCRWAREIPAPEDTEEASWEPQVPCGCWWRTITK